MNIFSVGLCGNYKNPNYGQKDVNFGAHRFIATTDNYECLAREYGYKGTSLTDFINKHKLAKPFKEMLEYWLPSHVQEPNGAIMVCDEDIWFNALETGRLKMIAASLFGKKRNPDISSRESYNSLKEVIDEYIRGIKEPAQAFEKVA